ncbi:MAG: helix-turn-helix domain-containing protein [Alicyclobacillaceae bacterium]|nr:helix-turn-helix domain-containing protein [Alicyclobacillaceae bacterium]
MLFGQRLRALRKSRNLTQQQLANKLQINRATYAKYETGSHQADYATLQKLADFFDVSVDYLLGRTDEPRPLWRERQRNAEKIAEFSKRLRHLRLQQNIAVEDLARAVGVTPGYIEKLEQCPHGLPGVSTLRKIAAALGVSVAYLVADTSDPQDPGSSDAWYQPKELKHILEHSDIMFDGVPLTDEDKQRIRDVLTGLFWEAKKMNQQKSRRKKE